MTKIIPILIAVFIVFSYWHIDKELHSRISRDKDISLKRKTANFIFNQSFGDLPRGWAKENKKVYGKVKNEPLIPLWQMPGGHGKQITTLSNRASLAIIQERKIIKDHFFTQTGNWYEVAYLYDYTIYRGWISAENIEIRSF